MDRLSNMLREDLFRYPHIGLPHAARDRQHRRVQLSLESGVLQVHADDREHGRRWQLTDRASGVTLAAIDPSGEELWWFDDETGDEHGVWRVEAFDPSDETDHERVAVDAGTVASLGRGHPAGLALGRRRHVVGVTGGDLATTIHVVEGGTGAAWVAARFATAASVVALSRDDRLLAVSHGDHGDVTRPAVRVLDLDAGGGTVAELWEDSPIGVTPVAFSPMHGSAELLVVIARDDRKVAAVWDVATGDVDVVDPQLPGDVQPSWRPDAEGLLAIHHYRARSELHVVDRASTRAERLPTPRGTVSAAQALEDGTVEYVWSSASAPPEVLAVEPTEGATAGTRGRPESSGAPTGSDAALATGRAAGMDPLPEDAGVVVNDVFADGPGGTVHALVIGTRDTPQTAGSGRPALFWIHGGPTFHDSDRWDPAPAAWAATGLVVVHVNYRGSTGYGASWQAANIGRPGLIELEDIIAVRDHLVDEGVIDPARVVLGGRSWGGYLTLLGLGMHPELWAAGVAVVPVGDTVQCTRTCWRRSAPPTGRGSAARPTRCPTRTGRRRR